MIEESAPFTPLELMESLASYRNNHLNPTSPIIENIKQLNQRASPSSSRFSETDLSYEACAQYLSNMKGEEVNSTGMGRYAAVANCELSSYIFQQIHNKHIEINHPFSDRLFRIKEGMYCMDKCMRCYELIIYLIKLVSKCD
jgi:hypothetical protein